MSRRRPALSPRTTLIVLAALLAGAAVVLLLGTEAAPDAAETPAAPQHRPTAEVADAVPTVVAMPEIAPELPATLPAPLSSPATPVDVEAPPAPATLPAKVLVGALTSDGRPLVDVLEQRWPDSPQLAVTVSTDVSGDSVSEQWLWFAQPILERDSARRITREPIQTPGYLFSLTIDDPLPVLAVLHFGPTIVAKQRVDPGDDSIWFVLKTGEIDGLTGTVQGQVVSTSTGAVIPQAKVSLKQGFFLELGRNVEQHPTTEGSFELEGVPAGTAFLTVTAVGFEQLALKIQVPRGRGLDLGTIALDEGMACQGRVVLPDGTPAKSFLCIRPADASSHMFDFPMLQTGPSDDDGKFWLGPIGRNRYLLTVTSMFSKETPGYAAFVIVDTLDGHSPELTVTLQPTTTVTLQGIDSKHSWTGFAIANESGDLLISFDGELMRLLPAKVAEEPFTLGFPAGRYSVQVARGDRIVWTKDFEAKGEPLTITLP